MHVIISTRGNHRWISGIFLDVRDAQSSCSALPVDADTSHALQAVQPGEFPFFILEDRSGFAFLTPTDAERVVAELPVPAEDAEPILYAILSEYRPEVAGRDEMGRLRHVHLDERQLAELRELGPLSIAT